MSYNPTTDQDVDDDGSSVPLVRNKRIHVDCYEYNEDEDNNEDIET
jgi:hypothetical protein